MEPKARKAIIQAIIFPLLNQLTASYTFLTYGTKIIEDSSTQVPVNVANLLLGIAQLLGIVFASILVDLKGRKFLLILSMGGCAFSHATLILYMQLHSYGFDFEILHWIPVACLISVVLFASIGIIPLTLLCLVETFPTHLRSFGVSFGSFALNVSTFLTVKMFPTLQPIISLQGCLLIFCVACMLGVLFIVVCVEETKGIDLNVSNKTNVNNNEKTNENSQV